MPLVWDMIVILGLLPITGQPLGFSSRLCEGVEAPADDKVVVESLNEEKFRKLIKERNGKILLLNVWATWCAPCVEEFPDLVRLHNESEGSSVEVVVLSIDEPEDVQQKIIPFLKQHHATMKAYVKGFKKDDALIDALNKNWSGAVPATFLYDTNGNQRSFLVGKRSLEQFKKELATIQARRR
ncbi:MAG: TlpA family protein disulfide reductase [Bacteroidota bacterium]